MTQSRSSLVHNPFGILLLSYAGVLTVLVIVQLAFFFGRPKPDLSKAVWVQKDMSLYSGEGPFEVHIRVADSRFSPLMMRYVIRYEAFITHQQVQNYGYLTAIDFDDEFISGTEGILHTKVTFDKRGVTMTQPLGKALFIPKKYFLGGR